MTRVGVMAGSDDRVVRGGQHVEGVLAGRHGGRGGGEGAGARRLLALSRGASHGALSTHRPRGADLSRRGAEGAV